MAYIGTSPSQGVRHRYLFTATSGQTTFSGADDDSRTLSYTDTKFMDVFLNGVLLDPNSDYTATNGTSVVLTSGASAGDLLEVIAFDTFSVFSGTFGGDVTVGGAFTSQGIDDNATSTAVTIDGSGDVAIGTTSTSGYSAAYRRVIIDGGDSPSMLQLNNTTTGSGTNTGGLAMVQLGADAYIINPQATGTTRFFTNNTEAARFNSSGNLAFPNGQGIDFSAVQSSATGVTPSSSILDDYEEGTWTPTNNGDATGVILAGSVGQYTKIGRMVIVQCQVGVTTNFTANAIGGLPFLPRIQSGVSNVYGAFVVASNNTATVFGALNDSFQSVAFHSVPVTGGNHNLNTSDDPYRFYCVYETNA